MDLTNFTKHNKDLFDLVLIPEENDVGGGKMKRQEIDVIKNYPNARSIQISGLDQKTFEYFIINYGKQFEAISFFKNKLVNDLSAFEELYDIKYICWFYNQRVTKLWNMEKNQKLKGLSLMDFSKLERINGIEKCKSLKFFEIGNEAGGCGGNKGIETLRPISDTNIEYLSLYCGVNDNDYSVLHRSKIKTLDSSPLGWELDELAEFIGGFKQLDGKITIPYTKSSVKDVDGKTTVYYFLCKGYHKLVGGKDDDILKKYVDNFNSLIRKYRDK